MTGSELRERREHADLTQDQVATVLDVSTDRVRVIERLAEVDQVTTDRFERAVALLIALRRQVARKVAYAARVAAAV